MIISNYIKMNYEELSQEINKQKKKIEAAKETIRLLEKLQIAETTKQKTPTSQSIPTQNGGNIDGSI